MTYLYKPKTVKRSGATWGTQELRRKSYLDITCAFSLTWEYFFFSPSTFYQIFTLFRCLAKFNIFLKSITGCLHTVKIFRCGLTEILWYFWGSAEKLDKNLSI